MAALCTPSLSKNCLTGRRSVIDPVFIKINAQKSIQSLVIHHLLKQWAILDNNNPPLPSVSHDLITSMFYSMQSCLTCNAASPKNCTSSSSASYRFQFDTNLVSICWHCVDMSGWIHMYEYYRATISWLDLSSCFLCWLETFVLFLEVALRGRCNMENKWGQWESVVNWDSKGLIEVWMC